MDCCHMRKSNIGIIGKEKDFGGDSTFWKIVYVDKE